MTFSILVPVYNVELYLECCIQSILCQTVQDFELILMDDGSTDGSGVICDQYARKYPAQIRVVHQKNKGALLTRNAAFALACGEYILCVDSDDTISPHLLERTKNVLLPEVDMVCFDYQIVSSNPENNVWLRVFPDEDKKTVMIPKQQFCHTMLTSYRLNSIWSKVFKRSLLNSEDSYESLTRLQYGEDLLQLFPIVNKTRNIAYLSEPLYFYNLSQTGMTRNYKKRYYEDMKRVYTAAEIYITLWKMQDYCESICKHQLLMVQDQIDQLTLPDCDLTIKERKKLITDISHDLFFRNRYQSANPKQRDDLSLLYHNQISTLNFFIEVRRTRQKAKSILLLIKERVKWKS